MHQLRLAVPLEVLAMLSLSMQHVAPCPVQSTTPYYLADVLEFGEAGRREKVQSDRSWKSLGFVGEFPLVKEHRVVEVCSDDFNEISLLNKMSYNVVDGRHLV
ncbi:hypothetical protein SCLCIDRAFT_29942 [Scleroderma citrinum Foug A]|uniref:Uncharacterized protein n=1 Tax=Scleroderma citrinum Foug A TaxID=1036808 RepID=A0A0C3DI69_9AGAM|nr:hypothetical protein SCLCIDRAFT_29942 [Scleroderma citrinum Foug A]